MAQGAEARNAFSRALLEGVHQPRRAKLCFVGPARAGKTSTLRALTGLPLRPDEESTPGLALWEVSKDFVSASPNRRWHLQEARGGAELWDAGVAQFVADCVRPQGSGGSSSSCCPPPPPHTTVEPTVRALDASVMKRMPCDLIARHLSEPPASSGSRDGAIVLETYDFGGQEVYYAMHHLFLTDFGLYLLCLDLSAIARRRDGGQQRGPGAGGCGAGDLAAGDDNCAAALQTWEALEWWLASISIFAPHSPVAIVGTHDDCLDAASRAAVYQMVQDRIVALCKRAPQFNEKLWVNEAAQLCFFPIDNSAADGAVSAGALRRAVDEMATHLLQGPLGEPVPLRWAHFWAVLQRAPDERLIPVCRTDDLWKRSVNYAFESPAELQRFLLHFRGLGALLHFPDAPSEDVRDLVCLNPAWVAEAAAAVLTAKDRVLQGCTRHSAELRERGVLHCELLGALWRPKSFARHQRHLLELLQALDLLMPWGHDRQSVQTSQRARAQEVFLVPALLPPRPARQAGEGRPDLADEDAVMVYLDFHGLLDRLLPTLFPRVLGTLSRTEAAVQILSVHANHALFTMSGQGQAKGDCERSQGGRRQVPKFLVSMQPCAGTELLRLSLRPRRTGCDPHSTSRPSWRHVDRLLHAFKDAICAWMPRLSFKAGVRCPVCVAGRAHPVDLHTVLRDDVPLCPRSGEVVEELQLPAWLAEWRNHHRPQSPATGSEACAPSDGGHGTSLPGVHLEYLYASPVDATPLDVRAEMEVLMGLPGTHVSVRTANAETLAEVWRGSGNAPAKFASGEHRSGGATLHAVAQRRILCLSTHVSADPTRPVSQRLSLILEDTAGCKHALSADDLSELLGSRRGGSGGAPAPAPFDAVVLHACHSEQLARRFIAAGEGCVVACAGTVLDAAARAFLRAFITALVTERGEVGAAFAAAQRSVRLSPQPGLRAEAERFRLLLGGAPDGGSDTCAGVAAGCGSSPELHPAAGSTRQAAPTSPQLSTPRSPSPPPFTLSPRRSLPRPAPAASPPSPPPPPLAVEDFVGRATALAAIAQLFLGGRRAVWLHGRTGLGKSALAAEFCRFYGLPGDRLFSPSASGGGGARWLRLAGAGPEEAAARLQEALAAASAGADPLHRADSAAGGRRWLLVLDGVDALLEQSSRDAVGGLWSALSDAISTVQNLRLLLTSRQPLYSAPLPCKVVNYEVPPLAPVDAALLLARRAHRPLFPRDLDASAGPGGDPLVLAGRQREFLQQLSGHPLLAAVGGAPGDILAAAAGVTPQLTSLYSHPLLQDSAASSSRARGASPTAGSAATPSP